MFPQVPVPSASTTLPTPQEPVPTDQDTNDNNSLAEAQPRLLRTSFPFTLAVSLCCCTLIDHMLAAGLSLATPTMRSAFVFASVALLLTRQILLITYVITHPQTSYCAGGSNLVILDYLIAGALLASVMNAFVVSTALAAVLYGFSLHTLTPYMPSSRRHWAPFIVFTVEAILAIFQAFAACLVFPFSLWGALSEAGKCHNLTCIWAPTISLVLANLALGYTACVTRYSVVWNIGGAWASLLVILSSPTSAPIRYAAALCIVLQFVGSLIISDCRSRKVVRSAGRQGAT